MAKEQTPKTKSVRVDTVAESPVEFTRKKRVFRGEQTLFHDLFKLKPAKLKRNTSYNEESPIIVEIEHCHIFHTIDSNGKKQDASIPIGGHFHLVKVVGEKDGVPQLEISTPKKWVMKKLKGVRKPQRVAADVFLGEGESAEQDEHVHEYEYLGSEEITLRKPNMEAMKLEGAIHALHNPVIEGVVEG